MPVHRGWYPQTSKVAVKVQNRVNRPARFISELNDNKARFVRKINNDKARRFTTFSSVYRVCVADKTRCATSEMQLPRSVLTLVNGRPAAADNPTDYSVEFTKRKKKKNCGCRKTGFVTFRKKVSSLSRTMASVVRVFFCFVRVTGRRILCIPKRNKA